MVEQPLSPVRDKGTQEILHGVSLVIRNWGRVHRIRSGPACSWDWFNHGERWKPLQGVQRRVRFEHPRNTTANRQYDSRHLRNIHRGRGSPHTSNTRSVFSFSLVGWERSEKAVSKRMLKKSDLSNGFRGSLLRAAKCGAPYTRFLNTALAAGVRLLLRSYRSDHSQIVRR